MLKPLCPRRRMRWPVKRQIALKWPLMISNSISVWTHANEYDIQIDFLTGMCDLCVVVRLLYMVRACSWLRMKCQQIPLRHFNKNMLQGLETTANYN